jgi:hypothetical protein
VRESEIKKIKIKIGRGRGKVRESEIKKFIKKKWEIERESEREGE